MMMQLPVHYVTPAFTVTGNAALPALLLCKFLNAAYGVSPIELVMPVNSIRWEISTVSVSLVCPSTCSSLNVVEV
jgi:hypothetical protein